MDEFIDLTYSTTPGPSTPVPTTVDEVVSLLTPEGSPIHEPAPPLTQTGPLIDPILNNKDPVEVISRPTGKSGSTEIRLELSQRLLQEDEVGLELLRKLQETGSNTFIQSDPQSPLQKPRRFILWQRWSRTSKKSELKFQFRYSYVLYIFKSPEFCDELLYDGLESFLAEVQSIWPSMMIAMMVINPKCDLMRKSDLNQKLMGVLLKFKGISFHSFEQITLAIDHVLYLTAMFEKPPPFKEENKFLSVFGGFKNSVGMKDVDLKLTMQSIESKELRNWINLLHTIPGMGPLDAHTVALHYPSFGALMEAVVDPTKSYDEKVAEIACLGHLSEKRTRVGQAAAKALFKFLTSIDSDTVL